MSIYNKNCIISGEVDHFCLLCKEAFKYKCQMQKHIEWINHKKNMKTLSYLKKFQKHKIYKIEHIYYCEVCGRVMTSRSSLGAHVEEDTHKANIVAVPDDKIELLPESALYKMKIVTRHEQSEFVLVCNLALNHFQWHTIMKNNCIMCDTVIGNTNELREHLSSINHMVRLIQSKCLIYNNEITHFFRMMNKDQFYCFVCEKILPMYALPKHWEEKEHAETLSAATSSGSSPPVDPKMQQVELKLLETQMPYYNIEEDPHKAVCKQCKESLPLKYIKLVKHRKKHTAVAWTMEPPETPPCRPKPIDYGQHRARMAQFAKENFMKTTHGGHRAFCLLCKLHLPATKKKITEHVGGIRHQGFLQTKGHVERKKIESLKPTQYVTLPEFMEHVFPLPSKLSTIINRRFIINNLSLDLILRIDIDKHYERTFCFVCETYFRREEEIEHINDKTHKEKNKDAIVLADIENELVRRIRECEYHCGYCNELWPSFKAIGVHVSKRKHKLARHNRQLPPEYSRMLYRNVTEDQMDEIVNSFANTKLYFKV